jgi:hypothetical protein
MVNAGSRRSTTAAASRAVEWPLRAKTGHTFQLALTLNGPIE